MQAVVWWKRSGANRNYNNQQRERSEDVELLTLNFHTKKKQPESSGLSFFRIVIVAWTGWHHNIEYKQI